MPRTGILPIIRLLNERIEDLKFSHSTNPHHAQALYALLHARNYLITARAELQKAEAA